MDYQSPMMPGETLIDHEYANGVFVPAAVGARASGRVPRDYGAAPYGSLPYATSFDVSIIIPKEEWEERIRDKDAARSHISQRLLGSVPYIPSLDQDGTNYCWCNAVVGAVQAVRAGMNEPYVALSACSVAAPVKGFSNQGGSGFEALDYIIKNGIAPLSLWPNDTSGIRRSYQNDVTDKAREPYKVTEWWELPPRNFDALISCLLLDIPVAGGLDWWGHEVLMCDAVIINQQPARVKELQDAYRADFNLRTDKGAFPEDHLDQVMDALASRIGVRFRNSWTDKYGDKGFNILTQQRATPDDACAPRVALAA